MHNGNASEEREKMVERIFEEIVVRNSSNFMKNINPHIQNTQRTISKINSKIFMSTFILIKLLKDKENRESIKREVIHHVQAIIIKININ